MSDIISIDRREWDRELGKMGKFIRRIIESEDLSKAQQRQLTKPAAKILRDYWRNSVPVLKNKGADPSKGWGPFQYKGGRWNKHVRYAKDGTISLVHSKGNLRKAIATKAWRKSRDSFTIVKTDHKGSAPKYDGWYHHFLEKGTKMRTVKINRHANKYGPTGRGVYTVKWAGVKAVGPRRKAVNRGATDMRNSIYRESEKKIPQWFERAAKKAGL